MSRSLEERLEQLELRNQTLEAQGRRMKRSGLAVVAVAGVALMMGQAAKENGADKAKFKSLEVGEITIVDEAGKPRLELGIDKDGTGLDIRDENGKVRMMIGLDKEGAGIEICDANGKHRVKIGEGPEDGKQSSSAGVVVYDEKERMRIALGFGKDGVGLIVLDENGKVIDGTGK